MKKVSARGPASRKPAPRKTPQKFNVEEFYAKLLGLLAHHSIESLSYSKISRWTGVTRPTLYYYFGKSRERMLREAVVAGARTFFQYAQTELHRDFPDYASFQRQLAKRAVEVVRDHPWAPFLVLRFQLDPGPTGEALREVQRGYDAQLARAYRHFHGRDPDPVRMRFASYLKLGLLYGLQLDHAHWYAGAAAPAAWPIDAFAETLARLLAAPPI